MSLFKLEQEKQFLSAAIRFPAILAECPLNERDFSPVNRVVFSALKACVAGGTEFSKFLLIDRLNSLNIKIADTIEPAIYVNAIEGLGVVEKAGIGIAKELRRTTVRRNLNEVGRQIQKLTEQDNDKKAMELVSEVTGVFNEKVNLLSGTTENEPVDLYATIPDLINAESTFDTRSIPSPFPLYNDLYGYFDPGNVYVWCARFKVGKSSFGMSMSQQMALLDKDDSLRILVLDTEMSREEVQSRIVSSLSGVKEFYVRHKFYNQPKYRHLRPKIEEAMDKMAPLWGKIEHIYIGGWSLESQLSTARRWAHKTLKGSKRGLLMLDYFKMNSAGDFASKTSRDILLGAKVDAYKNLVKKELQIPMVAFVQANREGEDTKAGNRMSNSTVIAGSDMIGAFASNIYLLEKLSPEQRAALGQFTPGSATHSCKLIAPRQLGPNELGHDKLVKFKEGKADRWCENYVLFAFESFAFKEAGTFEELYIRNASRAQVQPPVDKVEIL